ncbi:hypothetical protein GCM10027082_21670 [Comamonas humi]
MATRPSSKSSKSSSRKTSSSSAFGARLGRIATHKLATFVYGALLGAGTLSGPATQVQDWWHKQTASVWQSLDKLRQAAGKAPHAGAAAPPASTVQAPARKPPPATAAASPDFRQCAQQFPTGQPLRLADVGNDWQASALCSEGFAVLYSGLSKTPMVVVERLNRSRLDEAGNLARTDFFYADARLRSAHKAELSDYERSGYDRGHMAPAADQHTPNAMAQSFALSNMVPQDSTQNRTVWAKLESDVRKYARRAPGNVYVYTGPLHEGTLRTIGSNRVWVPSHIFKLVYDEQQRRAWGWVLNNDAGAQLGKPLDYAAFVKRTGWNLLPQLQPSL